MEAWGNEIRKWRAVAADAWSGVIAVSLFTLLSIFVGSGEFSYVGMLFFHNVHSILYMCLFESLWWSLCNEST